MLPRCAGPWVEPTECLSQAAETAYVISRVTPACVTAWLPGAQTRGVRRIVYCSSWSSYGRQPDGTDVTEESENLAGDKVTAAPCGGYCGGAAASAVPYFECKRDLEAQLRQGCEKGAGTAARQAVIIQPCR